MPVQKQTPYFVSCKSVRSGPLRIARSIVESGGGFERFVIARCRRVGGAAQQGQNLFLAHWFEGARRFDGLVQNLQTVNAGNHRRGRQVQGVVQAFDGADGFAAHDIPEAQRGGR